MAGGKKKPSPKNRKFVEENNRENQQNEDESQHGNERKESKQRRNEDAKVKNKRKSKSSPRKIKRSRVSFKDSEPEASENEEGKELENFEESPRSNAEVTTFREEDNEFVEMDVQTEEEFLSNEDTNDESDEEEGEISFNNNSTTKRSSETDNEEVETIMPILEEFERLKNKQKKIFESDEDRENRIVSKTVERLKEFMAKGDYLKKTVNDTRENKNKETQKVNTGKKSFGKIPQNEKETTDQIKAVSSNSESTIYQEAVQPQRRFEVRDIQKALNKVNHGELENSQDVEISQERRGSTSSEEELINTSDETATQDQISTFLLDVRNNADKNVDVIAGGEKNVLDQVRPSMSQAPTQPLIRSAVVRPPPIAASIPHDNFQGPSRTMEENVSQRIREAEATKADRMLNLQGRNDLLINEPNSFVSPQRGNVNDEQMQYFQANENGNMCFEPSQFVRTALMDEDYLIVAAHVDGNLERRIRDGEFVDFARLIPRDRVQMQQDNRLELVQRDGKLSCEPMSASQNDFSISCFARWEQAFRVFSNVYT